jgi:hypothetical protein
LPAVYGSSEPVNADLECFAGRSLGSRCHLAAGERPDGRRRVARGGPRGNHDLTDSTLQAIGANADQRAKIAAIRARLGSISGLSASPAETPGWSWRRYSPRRRSIGQSWKPRAQRCSRRWTAQAAARLMIAGVVTSEQLQQLLTIEQQHSGRS